MREKVMDIKPNNVNGGVDLSIERDSGNQILILMGKRENAIENWRRLEKLCKAALIRLEE